MEFSPKWIAWETTERCNLSCVHCRCSSDLNKKQYEIDTKKAFSLIDNIASYCQPVFVLSGGEPLLREDIFEVAQYADKKGFRVCMATNGSQLTDDICKNIKKSHIQILSLSLDGSTPDQHDNFRQSPGAFETTLKATNLLNQHHIKFIINSSFTKRNQSDIYNTFQLAKKIGASAWYMFMVVPTGRGKHLMDELISPPDYDKILKWHYEQEKKETILMRPTCAPHYYRLVHELNRQSDKNHRLKRRSLSFSTGGSKGCIAAQSICFINAKGDVHPCSYLPLTAGNVLKQKFKTIWEESDLFNNLRNFKSYDGKCGKCEYINICGGCRARSYCVTGDYMSPEIFCNHVPYPR